MDRDAGDGIITEENKPDKKLKYTVSRDVGLEQQVAFEKISSMPDQQLQEGRSSSLNFYFITSSRQEGTLGITFQDASFPPEVILYCGINLGHDALILDLPCMSSHIAISPWGWDLPVSQSWLMHNYWCLPLAGHCRCQEILMGHKQNSKQESLT